MLYETSGEEKQAEIVPVRKNEGFMDASQVLYVARAGNFRAHMALTITVHCAF